MLYILILVLIFCMSQHTTSCRYLAHLLNNICKLPHPGPNDIQGACVCRTHEGRDKYTFRDYLRSLF